jgi:hypothetical protein
MRCCFELWRGRLKKRRRAGYCSAKYFYSCMEDSKVSLLSEMMKLPALEKRKRLASAPTREARGLSTDSSNGIHGAQAIFKRHFEAHFKPLRLPEKDSQQAGKAPESLSGDDIEWDGISEVDGIAALRNAR